MAAPIDPERYVRLLAERVLLDGEPRTPWGGPVEQAAAALMVVGRLERGEYNPTVSLLELLVKPLRVALSELIAAAERRRGL